MTVTLHDTPAWYAALVARWGTMPPLTIAPDDDAWEWEPYTVEEHLAVLEEGLPSGPVNPLASVLQQWLRAVAALE